MDGASLAELMTNEGVTMTAGVPTVCLGLLSYLEETKTSLPALERVVIGGAAVPQSMIEAFEHKLGVEVRQAWGMTEMSPLGTVSVLRPKMRQAPEREQYRIQGKQGRPVFGVDLKIVDEQNKPLPHDGNAFGDLRVRGPWVCDGYYRLDHSPAHDADGWFSTGDVATVDEWWYMQITDRKKDLIKSGGEWISSVELENAAAGHPDVAQAAVIAIPDEKWDERPLLVVVPKANASPSKEGLREYLEELVPKWWVPDDVVFVEHLPLGATGKVLKNKLREEYAGRTSAEG
jgi:fatty-acyl-CoA synthase